ncbi:MAG TPA: hypothetical protein VHE78_01285 [Gemmatimonadaceae bacterium]|nr:hypothetical protein [Gemmatimonadaceae bacterium]
MLRSLSTDAIRILLVKHFDRDLKALAAANLLDTVAGGSVDEITSLLIELIGDTASIRTDAPTKYVFDQRLEELQRLLRSDGYEFFEGAIVRLMPAAESVAKIADQLDDILSQSPLDGDGSIRKLLDESRSAMLDANPDFNEATTKARIALETVGRRAARQVSEQRGHAAPSDTWGAALAALRAEGVISQIEEEALAKIYTLVSPGAHVPKGLTDEQWALLARTFAVSGTYFLLKQVLAA